MPGYSLTFSVKQNKDSVRNIKRYIKSKGYKSSVTLNEDGFTGELNFDAVDEKTFNFVMKGPFNISFYMLI
jgi:hypothetical protein